MLSAKDFSQDKGVHYNEVFKHTKEIAYSTIFQDSEVYCKKKKKKMLTTIFTCHKNCRKGKSKSFDLMI